MQIKKGTRLKIDRSLLRSEMGNAKREPDIVIATVIKEYKNYYLTVNESGIRECFMKTDINNIAKEVKEEKRRKQNRK